MQGWRRGAVAWLTAVFATFAAMLFLKLAFLACGTTLSPVDLRSPSGHVAAAAVVAGGLATLLVRPRILVIGVALLAAGIIGVSRLLLGMHSLPEGSLGAFVGLGGAPLLLPPGRPAPPPLELSRGLLLAGPGW